MQRRQFLQYALASGMAGSTGGLLGVSRVATAMQLPMVDRRVLVNLMLPGGPDMRHILPPAFNANPNSFGYTYWQAKADAHRTSDQPSAWESRWNNDFFHLEHNGVTFGLLNSLGWLKQQWDAGNVAIVNNAFGGTTRDHAHCIDIVDQGDLSFLPNSPYGSGWGGRLADFANGNVLALTQSPRSFCFGPGQGTGFDNSRLIPARNMRDLTLYNGLMDEPQDGSSMISRGLKSYYAAKRQQAQTDAVFDRFLDTERKLRQFGEPIDERLASIPVPEELEALTQFGVLQNSEFGIQMRNLHDAFACFDILNMRVASIDYGGWDTHERQGGRIEPQMEDIFGTGKALDVLFQNLNEEALDNTVLVVAGEFGRQLRANGDSGTDHGEGNSVLLIGRRVNGGLYGEMFPDTEMQRLSDPSPQIEGLTAMNRVFGEVSNWVESNSAGTVFPNLSSSQLEAGLDLSAILS